MEENYKAQGDTITKALSLRGTQRTRNSRTATVPYIVGNESFILTALKVE